MTTIEYADPLNVIIPIWKGMRNCIFARTFTKSSVKPLASAMGSSQFKVARQPKRSIRSD